MNLSQKKIFKHSIIATLMISLGGVSFASLADEAPATTATTTANAPASNDDHAARKARWEEFRAKHEQERTQRLTEMFKQADTNHDGKVSLAEWLAFKPARPDRQHDPKGDEKGGPRDEPQGRDQSEHHKDLAAWLQKVDSNHDGKISPAEAESYAPWIAKHFAEIDTNHDGLISQDELKAFQNARQAKREEEFKQHRTEEFKKANTSNDGQLTLAEWLAFKPHHHRGFGHHHGFFGGHHGFFDRDHGHRGQGPEDGRNPEDMRGDRSDRLNEAQAGARDIAKHFNEIDTDHNGQISQDELRAFINASHEKSQS